MNRPINTAALTLCLALAGCSDSNDSFVAEPPLPDLAAADAWLESFVANNEAFSGASFAVVDKQGGTFHRRTFGDHDEETVVLLASTSKVPTVMLLMALHEDDANIDFDISAPIANYLPWMGVWDAAITTEQAVANRSGIPGLAAVFIDPALYGAHICQFTPVGTLQACAQAIYETPLPDLVSTPPDTAFDYGGSQWTLAAAVAENVGGASWRQLWDAYIGGPCGLEVFQYGNMLSLSTTWTGDPDSLLGLDNPNAEGGAISNLDDYTRLLSLHLNEGRCGDNQVLSPESLAFMREDRSAGDIGDLGYGMGWWVRPPDDAGMTYLYTDPGFYGSVAWIDTTREYAGVVFFEEYTGTVSGQGSEGVVSELIPLIEAAYDAVRE